jgi:hypothetical protein
MLTGGGAVFQSLPMFVLKKPCYKKHLDFYVSV